MNLPRLLIIIFNISILAAYLAFMDIDSRLLSGTLIVLIAFCFLAFLLLKSKKASAVTVHNLQLSLGVVLLFFCALEIISRFYPAIIPINVRYFLNREGQASQIEYLDRNPYVLIKPRVTVRSPGYRGSDAQFDYEWKTDGNGFKNLPEFENLKKYKAIAVGNSFTEGMGVAAEKTWATILSQSGYPTYNLGVQSYAPSQFEGVFSRFGPLFNSEYVLIGYTGGIYIRELMLWNADKLKDKEAVRKFIHSKQAVALLDEIRLSARYLPSAILLFSRNYLKNFMSQEGIAEKADEKIKKCFQPYKREILLVGSEKDIKRINDLSMFKKEWERTLSAFLTIRDTAGTMGAKTIIIYFPHRGEMYYERALGHPLPSKYYEEYERNLIKTFAEKNGMGFIDISPTILKYMNRLSLDGYCQDYPYLEIDGHLSAVGNFLVAKEIQAYFQANEKKPGSVN